MFTAEPPLPLLDLTAQRYHHYEPVKEEIKSSRMAVGLHTFIPGLCCAVLQLLSVRHYHHHYPQPHPAPCDNYCPTSLFST